jgi:hypothetical protein
MDEKRLDKLDQRIDSLDQKLDDLTIIAVKNTAILEEHQRRSLALERHVEVLEKNLTPVETHVKLVNLLVKIIVAGSALALTLKNLI